MHELCVFIRRLVNRLEMKSLQIEKKILNKN